jgi:3-phenylpropionate/trans-cinnamate dioxygenase ferredoxin subunit
LSDHGWIDACSVEELQRQGYFHVNGQYEPVAIYCSGSGYFATSARCTHDGFTLLGENVAHGVVTCPRHGTQFCVRSGRRLLGAGISGLAVYQVRLEAGRIWVRSTGGGA